MQRRIVLAVGCLLVLAGGAFLALQSTAPAIPEIAFDAMPRPASPNYADPAMWAALPLADERDGADLTAADETLGEAQADAEADAFYIHPTTYDSADTWNQDLARSDGFELLESTVAAQASMFNACCQVYAPRYRQATLATETDTTGDSGKAEELAYQDVKAAFQYYVGHFHHERPFILAGHGQGARHLTRLLADVVDGTPLAQRMVAAYVTGTPLPRGIFGTALKTLAPCATPSDLSCVASWMLESRAAKRMIRHAKTRHAHLIDASGNLEILCVNPLTFDTAQPSAPATANLGSLLENPARDSLPDLRRALTGAACRDGLLHVDADYKTAAFPAVQETTLFYRSIRTNAVQRVEVFLQAGGGA